jgi:organic radical activating enzyme
LVDTLKENGFYVAIETSGAHPLQGQVDWYTFSPKKFKEPVEEAYSKASELKVVIYHKNDLGWELDHAQKVHSDCLLYIQPEWSKQERLLTDIIAFVKEHPNWKLSLQTHKYLNIP